MDAKMNEFLIRATAQEYERLFKDISLDSLLNMSVGDCEELLESVVNEEVRNNIRMEITQESRRRRIEENGVLELQRENTPTLEIITIDLIEMDSDDSESQSSSCGPRKKSKLDNNEMTEGNPKPNGVQPVPTNSGLLESGQDNATVTSSKEGNRILKRLSNKPAPPPFTKQEKELIHLNIVERSKSVNINGIFNLSWMEWAKRHAEGSLKPHHIAKLSIQWHYPEAEPLTRWLLDPLRNLKILEIFGDVGDCENHWDALKSIFEKAGGGLEEVVFVYKGNNDYGLKRFLMVMSGLDPCSLKGLKVLRMKNKCKDVGLIAEYWGYIKEISAPSLETIDIEFGFWMEEGTVKNFQDMCQKFARSLKRLIVHGCFYTDKKELPSVVLELPCMPKLELLDLGQSCQLQTIVENAEERPKKRRRKFVTVRQENGNEVKGQKEQMQDGEKDDTYGNYFSVMLKLHYMESLESLTLSMLYEIQNLHFTSFPKLRTFLVASEWDKTVTFPEQNARHFQYKMLKTIRFPNELEDPSFPSIAFKHFPNLESIHVDLPTVEVVRGLAEVLSLPPEENPCPLLSKLEIRMQFDFLSSFEACMLNEPWCYMRTKEELEQIAILKGYAYWQEYASVNKIRVPEYGQTLLPTYEQKGKGLEALKGKLIPKKNRNALVFECIPRKLRLPKGKRHFNDDECEFTKTLIGFDKNELPISKEVAVRLPDASLFKLFDICKSWMYFNKEQRYSWNEENIKVDPLQLPPRPEKDDDDNCSIRPVDNSPNLS